MSSWRERAAVAAVAVVTAAAALPSAGGPARDHAALPGIGRAATAAELAAWDIDVRPDFKGLPKGSGSVAKGQVVWENQCASCHGVFGESAEVFNPIVGGTTKADVETGRVARLTDDSFPGRTTLMKASQLSTLWDYINRAMPWTNPKSLSVEEVYAVTAYLLNLGGVLPDDFVLSDRNIAEVQQRLPNRKGMTTQHGLWPGRELGGSAKPDVQGTACMSNCAGDTKLASFLPDFARDAHGNLAEQNRAVGAQRGAETSRAPNASPAAPVAAAPIVPKGALALMQKHGCNACHAMDSKLVGPAWQEIAKKHAGRADAAAALATKIKTGGSGAWGAIPMPPQTLPETDARSIADWLAGGAAR